MNTVKWTQIICSSFLVILPAAIEYRNWKHHDRRTKVHRWITFFLLSFWILSAFGVLWAMYKDISTVEKKPQFAFYLNGTKCNPGKLFKISQTNGIETLEFTVQNVGNLSADGTEVFLSVRKEITSNAQPGWEEFPPAPKNLGSKIESFNSNTRLLSCRVKDIITPGDFFVCPPLHILWTNTYLTRFDFRLDAAANNCDRQGVVNLVLVN